MSANIPPIISCEKQYPVLPVKDIQQTVDYYVNQLGFSPGFVWGEPLVYGGVNLGNVTIHFSSQMTAGQTGLVNFIIDDADALHAYHLANGVNITVPIDDREYGIRDYSVIDSDGNTLSFGHYIYTTGEPIPIERVAVPLRLEKRLAAVLNDLAQQKNTSLDSLIEETLLHTFEILGDGCACPHTLSTLRFIQTLKEKHGIDYDVHGSYRFVEKKDTA